MEGRGLDCSDVSDAEALLKSIGYYRLSGYLYPFLKIPKEEHLFKVKAVWVRQSNFMTLIGICVC